MTATIVAAAAVVLAAGLVWQLSRVRTQRRQEQLTTRRVERDLSAQLQQATLLRENLLKAVEDALFVVDSTQVIVYANPVAEALVGKNPVGATLLSAIRQPELETLLLDAQLVHGESLERRVEYARRVLHARAVAPEDGQAGYEVLTLRDVTELQRLERARREMVSNITHELSTPITSIGLLADTLISVSERGKTKQVRKIAQDVRREIDTLTHLVQEVRDLAQIESGQMPVRMTSSVLGTVVARAVDALTALAENKQQTIAIAIGESVTVLADEPQLERALKNIIHNAIKFSPERGAIHIAATANGHEAVVSVSDEGPGIPADDLARIFERFFQVDRARHEGTGLGLAIVRHIVEAHGGRVWVESVEGQGATFYLSLALADTPARLDDRPLADLAARTPQGQ